MKVIESLKNNYKDKLPIELNFAIVNNQLYAIRQNLSINLEINKVFKEDGLGNIKINTYPLSYKLPYYSESQYFSKKGIESEFAATIVEYAKASPYNGYIDSDIELKDLLFKLEINQIQNIAL